MLVYPLFLFNFLALLEVYSMHAHYGIVIDFFITASLIRRAKEGSCYGEVDYTSFNELGSVIHGMGR